MKKVFVLIAILVTIVTLFSCTYIPQFVKGQEYIIEGEYTSFHTENGNYIYIVGGNTIILGNRQEQPSLTIGHVYRITWKYIDKPGVEIVSVKEE